MKKSSKILAMLLVLVMALSLSACGLLGGATGDPAATDPPASVASDASVDTDIQGESQGDPQDEPQNEIPTPPASSDEKPSSSVPSSASSATLEDQMTTDAQRFVYSYTAPRTGRYRLDLVCSNVNKSIFVLIMFDDKNNKIADNISSTTGGKTFDLESGKTYKIETRHKSGDLNYKASVIIGVPNEVASVTGSSIAGKISYTDQQDRYVYTAPKTGRYRFDFQSSNITDQYLFSMWDGKNKVVVDNASSNLNEKGESNANISGKTVDLEQGQEYRINVVQTKGFIDYKILIGIPKDPQTISGNEVSGSMDYTDQCDVYYYTASSSGVYTFNFICNYRDDANERFSFYMSDSKNKAMLDTSSNVKNKSVTLKSGETYVIQIKQNFKFPTYKVTIVTP